MILFVIISNLSYIEDNSENSVILDGGEGASEYILYGTNVDWKKEKDSRQDKIGDEPHGSDPIKNSLLYT